MSARITIALEEDLFEFVEQNSGNNRSAFIAEALKEKRALMMREAIAQACREEAEDLAYQDELSEWDVCVADGIAEQQQELQAV